MLIKVKKFFPQWAALCLILVGLFGFLPSLSAQTISLDLGGDGSLTLRLVQIILLVTVLSLAPSILIMVTSFTRLVVVFSLLRNALGLQNTPPNAVLISLSLFLTLFIMQPTFERAFKEGVLPLTKQEIDIEESWKKSTDPFHQFMAQHVRSSDLELFMDLSRIGKVEAIENVPLRVLTPAFMISELRRAFEIGFLIFLPFLIIDIVVASILMSMGMMMVPPVMISLPFKLIFFVLIDGWHLIAGSLVRSFSGS